MQTVKPRARYLRASGKVMVFDPRIDTHKAGYVTFDNDINRALRVWFHSTMTDPRIVENERAIKPLSPAKVVL